MSRKPRPTSQETDRILAVDLAIPELQKQFKTGWSRDSIRRKIKDGVPFQWIEGTHYLRGNLGRGGQGICSLNIDAIRRSWIGQ